MAVFSQKKGPEAVPAPAPAQAPAKSTVVGKTLVVKGDVYSEDEILVEGKIQGKIRAKSRVVIGRGGVVEAEIEGRDVVIQGKVTGDVRGSQRVEIVPEGTLHGNIHAPRVVIADSAFFEGNIEMRPREDKPRAGEDKGAIHAPHGGEGAAKPQGK